MNQPTFAEDRADYRRFLTEYGFTEDQARATSEWLGDHVPLPLSVHKLCIARSARQGRGIFSTATRRPKELVAPARLAGMRTQVGRLTNHSCRPNGQFETDHRGDIFLVARSSVEPGEELTVDYRQACSVNGWGLRPDIGETLLTLHQRIEALNGEVVWSEWSALNPASRLDALEDLLYKHGYLPSIVDMQRPTI